MPPKRAAAKAAPEAVTKTTRGSTTKVKIAATEDVAEASKKRTRTVKGATEEATTIAPKKVGRPAKRATTAPESDQQPVAPKPRGRPPKAKVETKTVAEEDGAVAAPKKRGRPAKTKEATTADPAPPAKKRGRPPKTEKVDEAPKRPRGRPTAKKEAEAEPDPPPKKRGRPAKATKPAEAIQPAPPKKRGRPPKVTADNLDDEPAPKKRGRPTKKAEPEATQAAKRPRGRPAKSATAAEPATKAVAKTAKAIEPSSHETPGVSDPIYIEEVTDDRGYWLMKAEPDSRFETTESGEQVDVKFTIDDLAERGIEPWDGIRNLQAQKHLRAMDVGDLCFFSESSCKVPGIVGIMQVVGTAQPDPSQFNRSSPYYDPKSLPSKPKWSMVLVRLGRKFATKLPSKDLKEHAEAGGPLAGLQLFKQSRLSVSKVEPEEFAFILSLVDKQDQEENDANAATPAKSPKEAGRSSLAAPSAKKSPTKKHVTIDLPDDTALVPVVEMEQPATPAKRSPGRPRKSTSSDNAAATITTPVVRGRKAVNASTPATEPAAGRKSGAGWSTGQAIPATEPRKRAKASATTPTTTPVAKTPSRRGRPSAVKAESAKVIGPETPAQATPKPRGRPPKTATPATEPPKGKKRAAPVVPATEPRKRARISAATPATTPVATSPAKRERSLAVKAEPAQATPKPRGRPPKSVTPATEPQKGKKRVAPAVPATEPRKRAKPDTLVETATPTSAAPARRGRTPKSAAATPVADKSPAKRGRPPKSATNAPAEEKAARVTPAPRVRKTARIATPASEPKRTLAKTPTTSKKRSAPAPPATEPRKRSKPSPPTAPLNTPAANKKTPAKGKQNPQVKAKTPSAPTPASREVNGSAQYPTDDGLRISIHSPTELNFTLHSEDYGPDVRDVTNDSTVSASLFEGVAGTFTSPSPPPAPRMGDTVEDTLTSDWQILDHDDAVHGGDGPLFADSFTAQVDAAAVFDHAGTPVAQSTEVDHDGDEHAAAGGTRKSLFGRIGEGIFNVVASPGRAMSRALSRTPGPDAGRSGTAEVEPVAVPADGEEAEGANAVGGMLPVTVEEVPDRDM